MLILLRCCKLYNISAKNVSIFNKGDFYMEQTRFVQLYDCLTRLSNLNKA